MDPEQTTSLCNSCPKLCRFTCPVADVERDESTTPWGKMSAMKLADDGKIAWDARTASLAYKCLQCGASEGVCELHNPVPETLLKYRIRAFQTGVAPAPLYPFVKEFQDHNNPCQIDLFERLKTEFPEEMKKPFARIAYFAGCTEIRYFPDTIGKTLRLLREMKIAISLFQEPILCCGYPLYAAGDLEGFKELAEINVQSLKKYREVWSSCAECLYTMEVLYREMGFSFSTRFFHVSEKIPPSSSPSLTKRGRGGDLKIAYHDPCSLGRYRKIYDAPRKIIEQVTGQPPVEFHRNREGSYCCGAGGLVPVTSPKTADQITRNRLEEFRATGATRLVTACPNCVRRFQEVDPKLDVVSLIDFLAV
ncbi:MAG: (Fe-S)-binding protein [Deltaproteobacteria bacterium]|nr:(Fe-S)-binding protein [Deltaproteobacteria bacterium]MBI4373287.1 (Fe-S)-binding protein [Deltaproteobacteria bacterium]